MKAFTMMGLVRRGGELLWNHLASLRPSGEIRKIGNGIQLADNYFSIYLFLDSLWLIKHWRFWASAGECDIAQENQIWNHWSTHLQCYDGDTNMTSYTTSNGCAIYQKVEETLYICIRRHVFIHSCYRQDWIDIWGQIIRPSLLNPSR